jgi:hypothetical protein
MDRRTFLLSPLALWGCGGSGGDIMSNASNLGSLPTTQGTAFAFTPGGYPLNTFYQQPNEQMFADAGAAINRINDRLLIGEATKSDGTSTYTNKNWLETFYASNLGAGSYTAGAQCMSLTGTNPVSQIGLLGAGQTLNSAGGAFGLMGFAMANKAGTYPAWGLYIDAILNSAGVSATVSAAELQITNLINGSGSTAGTPYQAATTVGIQLGSGSGFWSQGARPPCYSVGAAIQIVNNGAPFQTGINFNTNESGQGDCLVINNSVGNAISLGQGHQISWYNSASQAGSITSLCAAGNNTLNVLFGINKLQFLDNANGEVVFQFARIASAVNGIQFVPAVAGSPPYILPNPGSGGDANIDLRLLGYGGSGYVRFGTYVGSTITNTGYITIKDDAGTLRRLMVG